MRIGFVDLNSRRLSDIGKRNCSRAYPKVETTKRQCLCCGKTFESEGIGNRVCRSCKNQSTWSSGGDLSMGVIT